MYATITIIFIKGIMLIIFALAQPPNIKIAGIHHKALRATILTINNIGITKDVIIFINAPIPTTQLVLCCLA